MERRGFEISEIAVEGATCHAPRGGWLTFPKNNQCKVTMGELNVDKLLVCP